MSWPLLMCSLLWGKKHEKKYSSWEASFSSPSTSPVHLEGCDILLSVGTLGEQGLFPGWLNPHVTWSKGS